MIRHQPAAELERVDRGRLGELVDEAFEEDRVLVDVHAAPEPGRNVRIAHRVADQQVRNRVFQRMFARRPETLECRRVLAVFECLGAGRRKDRLPRQPDVKSAEPAFGIERADELRLHDRVVAAVRHVFLARPQQLDRRTRHLLGDRHRLAHVVRETAAPEAAAEKHFVDIALAHRKPRGLGRRGERRLAVLRRAPDLAAFGGVERRRVHRLHRRVVLVGIAVDRLERLRRAGDRGVHVAGPVVHVGLIGVEPGGEHRVDRCTRDAGVRTPVPFDRDRVEGGLRAPPGVGDNGDRRVADANDLAHTRHRLGLRRIERLDLAAEHRAIADRGVQHPGQFQVGAIDLLASELVGGVEPLQGLADDGPARRVLQRDVGRRRKPRSGIRHLPVGRVALRGLVDDDAPGDAAFGRRHLPLIGSGLHQHHPRRRATLADVVLGAADPAAAAGAEVAPDTLARDVLSGRREFCDHPGPVEFLGDELREAGHCPLPHLRASDPHDDGFVGADHNPGIDLVAGRNGCGIGRGRVSRVGAAKRNPQPKCQPAAGSDGADQEGAAIHRCRCRCRCRCRRRCRCRCR